MNTLFHLLQAKESSHVMHKGILDIEYMRWAYLETKGDLQVRA